MTIALTNRDLASVRQLLLAAPDPDDRVLPHAAAMALARLVPCDAIGAAEVDEHGFVLRGFDEPSGVYDHLGPQICDGPVSPGLRHLLRTPAHDPDRRLLTSLGIRDTLQLGFGTPAGTVVQVYLDRVGHVFTERDVLLLVTLEPALRRIMLSRPRLRPDALLSRSELRVLELVAAGASNRDAAAELGVCVATVRKHLENAYRKLGVANRTAAVAALSEDSPFGEWSLDARTDQTRGSTASHVGAPR